MVNRRDVNTGQSDPDQATVNAVYNAEQAKKEDPAAKIKSALQELVDAASTLRVNQGPSGEPEAVRWNRAVEKAREALGS